MNGRHQQAALAQKQTKTATMSVFFELWRTIFELYSVEFIAAPGTRHCMPKIDAVDFKGNTFGCSGERLLFQRKNEGAEFRLVINSGEGGVHQIQPSGRVLVIPKPPPFVFALPTKRQWTIASKKLKGKHTMAREITIVFDEAGGGDQNEIRNITITIPISNDSDQAHVFSFGLDWAAKVVEANIAYVDFYAAVTVSARHNVHGNP
jgi:hypothetical protein